MKSFFQWFTNQWRINSDWPRFTYWFLGLFYGFELLYQIVNGPTVAFAFIGGTAFYVFIACPLGYFYRNKP